MPQEYKRIILGYNLLAVKVSAYKIWRTQIPPYEMRYLIMSEESKRFRSCEASWKLKNQMNAWLCNNFLWSNFMKL